MANSTLTRYPLTRSWVPSVFRAKATLKPSQPSASVNRNRRHRQPDHQTLQTKLPPFTALPPHKTTNMTVSSPLVTDASLQSVLTAADLARTQSLAILDLLDAHHASSDLDPTAQQLELSAQQKKLNAHLAHLRGLNRKAVLGVRSTKQETGEARQEIDALHLQLQNLYYEQRHLRGEIAGCEDYE